MASRVNYSEAQAREIAKNFGLVVTKTATTCAAKQLMVGRLFVHYDKSFGGCACWRVGDIRCGYKGEAMVIAAYAQTDIAYPPFLPGGCLMRAFIAVRKSMTEKVAA